MENKIFIPSEVKVFVNLDRIGSLTMDDYDFSIECYTDMSPRVVSFDKKDALRMDEDTYFVVLNTGLLAPGMLKVRVTANIPDSEINRARKEVIVFDTGKRLYKA